MKENIYRNCGCTCKWQIASPLISSAHWHTIFDSSRKQNYDDTICRMADTIILFFLFPGVEIPERSKMIFRAGRAQRTASAILSLPVITGASRHTRCTSPKHFISPCRSTANDCWRPIRDRRISSLHHSVLHDRANLSLHDIFEALTFETKPIHSS